MAKNTPVAPVFSQADSGTDDFDFDNGADPAMRNLDVPGREDEGSSNLPSAFPEDQIAEAEEGQPAAGRDAGGRFSKQQEQPVGQQANEGAPTPRPQPRPQMRGGQQPQGVQREEAGDVVFPPELLREAGMTEQQALYHYQTPDALEKALAFHDSQLIRSKWTPPGPAGQQAFQPQQQQFQQPPLQRQQQFQQPPQQQPFQQQSQQAPQQGQQGYQQPQQQQQPAGLQKLAVALDPNAYEPEVIKVFNDLNDHYHQHVSKQQQEIDFLRNSMSTLVQTHVAESQRQYYNEFDQIVNSLGDEYKDVFGKGTYNDLDQSTPQWQNRLVLDQTVAAYQQALSERGMRPVSTKTAILKAVRAEFPQQYDTTIRKEVTSQIGLRQKQFSPRPAGRRTGNSGNLSPESLAISNVESLLRDRGHESPQAEQEVSF